MKFPDENPLEPIFAQIINLNSINDILDGPRTKLVKSHSSISQVRYINRVSFRKWTVVIKKKKSSVERKVLTDLTF